MPYLIERVYRLSREEILYATRIDFSVLEHRANLVVDVIEQGESFLSFHSHQDHLFAIGLYVKLKGSFHLRTGLFGSPPRV